MRLVEIPPEAHTECNAENIYTVCRVVKLYIDKLVHDIYSHPFL